MIPPPNAARYAKTLTSLKREPSASSAGTAPFCVTGRLVRRRTRIRNAARRLRGRCRVEERSRPEWPARRRCSTSRGRWRCSPASGSGIGKASAETLAARRRDDRRRRHRRGRGRGHGRARSTAAGGTAVVQRTDVTQRADVDALVDRAASEFGRVDIVGNIAGVPHNKIGGRVHRRRVRAHPRDQPEERLLRLPGRDPAHGSAGFGLHRQHLVGRDRHARADARVLRHDEGGGRDAHEDARDGGRAAAASA